MCLIDRFMHVCRAGALILGLGLFCIGAQSAPLLTLTPSELAATGLPGQMIEFRGSITNRTTVDLSSTDLILNVYDFDPLLLEPTSHLGTIPFVVGTYSVVDDVALFSINVALAAATGLQSFQVTLQDVYGNFSDPVAMTIEVLAVPELSAWMMLFCGALVLGLFSRRAQCGGPLFSDYQGA